METSTEATSDVSETAEVDFPLISSGFRTLVLQGYLTLSSSNDERIRLQALRDMGEMCGMFPSKRGSQPSTSNPTQINLFASNPEQVGTILSNLKSLTRGEDSTKALKSKEDSE